MKEKQNIRQTNLDWEHSTEYLVSIPQDHKGHKTKGKTEKLSQCRGPEVTCQVKVM